MPATTATRSCEAIQAQAAELDFAPTFQFGHPRAFELASRIAALAPGDLDHVFFCNSGSEAADTALKIALAYWNARGQAQRTRFIGRERGYHGVGFGGMAVGGLANNRKAFGAMLPGVDHLPHTYNREQQAFSKGEPEWGAHLADELERIVALHGDTTIAAVIVEPMAGSTAVLPAPKGYLQRLRAICDKYGILLIFDEVITGFGRLGHAFAAERYGVVPGHDHVRQGRDLGQRADGRRDRAQGHPRRLHARAGARRGVLPRLHLFGASARLRRRPCRARPLSRRGPVRARQEDRAALVRRRDDAEGPAAACSTSAASASPPASISPRGPTRVGKRGFEAMERGFHDEGIMFRIVGDSIAVTPPLIVSESQIGEIFDKVGKVIKALA